jgi:hypothetical protein
MFYFYMLALKTAVEINIYLLIEQNSIGKEACTSKEPNGGGNLKVPEKYKIMFSKKMVSTPAIIERVIQISKIRPGNFRFAVFMTPSMVNGSCKFVSLFFLILY